MIQEPCAICGKLNEDERSIFEQNGYVLCRGHHELFNDEELEVRAKMYNKWGSDIYSLEELFNNHKKFMDDNYYLLNKLEQEIQACISGVLKNEW